MIIFRGKDEKRKYVNKTAKLAFSHLANPDNIQIKHLFVGLIKHKYYEKPNYTTHRLLLVVLMLTATLSCKLDEVIHPGDSSEKQLYFRNNWTDQENCFLTLTIDQKFMLDYYYDSMISSLIEFNEGIGTENYFKGLIYNGYPENVLFFHGIDPGAFLIHYSNYINFIGQPRNISSQVSSCQ